MSKDSLFKLKIGTPVNLIEDPILMYSNHTTLLNKPANKNTNTNLNSDSQNNKKNFKVNFADIPQQRSVDIIEQNFFNNKRASIDVSNSGEGIKPLLLTNSAQLRNRRRHSDLQLSAGSNRSFHNALYHMDTKKSNSDFFDYSDDEFIEEDDEDEEDDDEIQKSEFESNNELSNASNDENEDKNEYSHFNRVLPLKSQLNESNKQHDTSKTMTTNQQNLASNDKLDTINESIRENNYETLPKNVLQKNTNEAELPVKASNVTKAVTANNPQKCLKKALSQPRIDVKSKNVNTTNLNKPKTITNNTTCTIKKPCNTDKTINNKPFARSQSIDNKNRPKAAENTKSPNINLDIFKPTCDSKKVATNTNVNKKPIQKPASKCTNNLNTQSTAKKPINPTQKSKLTKPACGTKIDFSKTVPSLNMGDSRTNDREYERVIDCVPNFIESSRMQKSKEIGSNLANEVASSGLTEVTLEQSVNVAKPENISTTTSTSVVTNVQQSLQQPIHQPVPPAQLIQPSSVPDTVQQKETQKQAKPIPFQRSESSKGILKQKSSSTQNLEVNSNKINLTTKPPSAKLKKAGVEIAISTNVSTSNTNVSTTIPTASNSTNKPTISQQVSFDNNKNTVNDFSKLLTFNASKPLNVPTAKCNESIVEPTVPVIYDMFENFKHQHPFATNMMKPLVSSAMTATKSSRNPSASRKTSSATNAKKKKATTTTNKKKTKSNKQSKNKTTKIVVSKNEINLGGHTTTFTLENQGSENLVEFVNAPTPQDMNEYDNYEAENDFRINDFDDEDDDDDDDSDSDNESDTSDSDISVSSSNIPVVSIGDINAITENTNEIEIDNGEANCNTDVVIDLDNQNVDNDTNENITSIDTNLMKSVSAKVDAIYAKLDNVINSSSQVKNNYSKANDVDSDYNEVNYVGNKVIKLNQKLFDDNVDFSKYSDNSGLVKQLNDVYGASNNQNVKSNTANTTTATTSYYFDKSKDSINNNSMRSTKSNANIREVYTMINSLKMKSNNDLSLADKNCQSLNSTENKNQQLPPKPYIKDKINTNATATPNTHKKVYELPPLLSDKINSLIEMTTSHNDKIVSNIKPSPKYEVNNIEIKNNLQPKERVSRLNYVII